MSDEITIDVLSKDNRQLREQNELHELALRMLANELKRFRDVAVDVFSTYQSPASKISKGTIEDVIRCIGRVKEHFDNRYPNSEFDKTFTKNFWDILD